MEVLWFLVDAIREVGDCLEAARKAAGVGGHGAGFGARGVRKKLD
jgi:hypothetical protein